MKHNSTIGRLISRTIDQLIGRDHRISIKIRDSELVAQTTLIGLLAVIAAAAYLIPLLVS